MSVDPLDDELRTALVRMHRAVVTRSVPAALSESLRMLPTEVRSAEPEVLTVVADSRQVADRSSARGPTLANSYLLTFGAATIDVAIDVFADDDSRTAQLRGVVLDCVDAGPFDVSIGTRAMSCDAHGSFRFDDHPFGTFAASVTNRRRPSEVLARFTLVVA